MNDEALPFLTSKKALFPTKFSRRNQKNKSSCYLCLIPIFAFLFLVDFDSTTQPTWNFNISESDFPLENYHSQFGEDKFLVERFFSKQNAHLMNGTFLEIGAFDGISYSNTLFFEETLHWTGYLIEGSPKNYARLKVNRDAEKNVIVGNAVCPEGMKTVKFRGHETAAGIESEDKCAKNHHLRWNNGKVGRIEVEVDCITVEEIFEIRNPGYLDFMTVDMECAEMNFLRLFPWGKVYVGIVVVESHHVDEVRTFLQEKGLDHYDTISGIVDNEVFVNKSYVKELKKALKQSIE